MKVENEKTSHMLSNSHNIISPSYGTTINIGIGHCSFEFK